jgi:hypothetical protein
LLSVLILHLSMLTMYPSFIVPYTYNALDLLLLSVLILYLSMFIMHLSFITPYTYYA